MLNSERIMLISEGFYFWDRSQLMVDLGTGLFRSHHLFRNRSDKHSEQRYIRSVVSNLMHTAIESGEVKYGNDILADQSSNRSNLQQVGTQIHRPLVSGQLVVAWF